MLPCTVRRLESLPTMAYCFRNALWKVHTLLSCAASERFHFSSSRTSPDLWCVWFFVNFLQLFLVVVLLLFIGLMLGYRFVKCIMSTEFLGWSWSWVRWNCETRCEACDGSGLCLCAEDYRVDRRIVRSGQLWNVWSWIQSAVLVHVAERTSIGDGRWTSGRSFEYGATGQEEARGRCLDKGFFKVLSVEETVMLFILTAAA